MYRGRAIPHEMENELVIVWAVEVLAPTVEKMIDLEAARLHNPEQAKQAITETVIDMLAASLGQGVVLLGGENGE